MRLKYNTCNTNACIYYQCNSNLGIVLHNVCCIRFMIFAVNPGYGYMCGLDFYRFAVLLLIRTVIVHTSRKCILYKIF